MRAGKSCEEVFHYAIPPPRQDASFSYAPNKNFFLTLLAREKTLQSPKIDLANQSIPKKPPRVLFDSTIIAGAWSKLTVFLLSADGLHASHYRVAVDVLRRHESLPDNSLGIVANLQAHVA